MNPLVVASRRPRIMADVSIKIMKKPNENWINDWIIGENTQREKEISSVLVKCFIEFWEKQSFEIKSKATINRYYNSLHALGGYIVEHSIEDDCLSKTAIELLNESIGHDDGPLIYQDNENWQNELDMVCRKLYKYIQKKC